MEKVNVDSFKERFLSLHPKLYRVAFALVENKTEAEDILQDAYCKLWNRREELTEIQNPEAFSVTLVKNLCLDFLRSARANRREEQIESVQPACESTPDREMEKANELEIIKKLIERLPENQRRVLKLRGFDDCSMDEIEEITGLSAVNIRTLLSRARKAIREQYIKITIYER